MNRRPTRLLLLLPTLLAVPAFGGVDPASWIDTTTIGDEILHNKIEQEIEPAAALKLLAEHPQLVDDWQSHLPSPPEPHPQARTLPDDPKFQKLYSPTDRPPATRVTGYSDATVIVKVLRPMGGYLWHHYFDCLATLRIPRTPKVDRALNLAALESTFGREVDGIRQGTPPKTVRDVLGEPAAQRTTQAVGFYFWYYPERNLTVVFQGSRVKELRVGTEGIPEPSEWPKEPEDRGDRLSR